MSAMVEEHTALTVATETVVISEGAEIVTQGADCMHKSSEVALEPERRADAALETHEDRSGSAAPVADDEVLSEEASRHPEQAIISARPSASTCPGGHALRLARAAAGTCDGCGQRVGHGQVVSECMTCNWYQCTACCPITKCPEGHNLQSSAAVAGTCDGCGRRVKESSPVSDCRACNWYLCSNCQAPSQVPAPSTMVRQRAGNCALCRCLTNQEDVTISANGHIWHICINCSSGGQRATMRCALCRKGTLPSDVTINSNGHTWRICAACEAQRASTSPLSGAEDTVAPLPKCPAGHAARPATAQAGKRCGRCVTQISSTGVGVASECSQCDWHLCTGCHPITQCPKGHKLEARLAVAGTCDGCRRRVKQNQCVLSCLHCNWYLCGSCHMVVARGGA